MEVPPEFLRKFLDDEMEIFQAVFTGIPSEVTTGFHQEVHLGIPPAFSTEMHRGVDTGNPPEIHMEISLGVPKEIVLWPESATIKFYLFVPHGRISSFLHNSPLF